MRMSDKLDSTECHDDQQRLFHYEGAILDLRKSNEAAVTQIKRMQDFLVARGLYRAYLDTLASEDVYGG